MSREKRVWVLTLAMAGLLASPALCAAPAELTMAGTGCSRVSLGGEAPGWISSAVWADSRSRVLVVDPSNRSLLLYGADGVAERLGDPRPDKAGAFRPSRVSNAGDGFLLKLTGSQVVRLSADLRQETALDLRQGPAGEPSGIGSLYEWVVVGDRLVGYGSVRGASADVVRDPNPTRPFQLGFLTAELGRQPARARLLLPLEEDDYYVLGHPYVTANDLGPFVLAMGRHPRIYRVSLEGDGQVHPLRAMPADVREVAELGMESTGPESSQALFARVESLRMPVGLYGQGEMLYLLTRKPDTAQEGIAWFLHQIDPARDEVVGGVRLPTSAHHLTVVPGPGSWFVFEKGPVEAWGEQEIASMLVIPRAWIDQPADSPLSLSGPAVTRCAER